MTSYRRKNDEKRLKLTKIRPFSPFESIFTKFLAHESISWLQIPKEEYLGLRLREKNHGVDQLEKSLRSFKKNSRKKPNFFVILNFDGSKHLQNAKFVIAHSPKTRKNTQNVEFILFFCDFFRIKLMGDQKNKPI